VLDIHKDLNNRQPFTMSTCCEGQGTRMIGAIPEFIYSVAGDGVYVDLFSPSTIKFATPAGTISLKMVTGFPYDSRVQLLVDADKPSESIIRIRVPSWAAHDMTINVNGKKAMSGKPGTYVSLSRLWKKSDEITFTIPMKFSLTRYTGEEKEAGYDRYALEYGPLLMAYVNLKDQNEKIVLPMAEEKLVKSLKPVAGKPLHFTVGENSSFEYMPYFEVQDETFSCYPLSTQKN
jgi:DUF1680 family protein